MRLATSPCHWRLLRERRSKGPSRTGKPGACHPLTLKTTRDVARARGTMATKPPPSLPPSGCPALKGRRLHSVTGASVALHATPARPRGDHTASCLPQPGLEGTPVGHRCGCRLLCARGKARMAAPRVPGPGPGSACSTRSDAQPLTCTPSVSTPMTKTCPPEAAQSTSSVTSRLLTGSTPNFITAWGSGFQAPS